MTIPALGRELLFRLSSSTPVLLSEGQRKTNRPGTVAVTYDDGPSTVTTKSVLDTLDTHRARASFFLLADEVRTQGALAREIVDRGHDIGCHGLHHRRMHLERESDIRTALKDATRIIEDATGTAVKSFRPPYGWWNPLHSHILDEFGLRLVLWDCMCGDYLVGHTEREVAEFVFRRLRDRGILVLHDGGLSPRRAVSILEPILHHIRQRGWNPVTISEGMV